MFKIDLIISFILLLMLHPFSKRGKILGVLLTVSKTSESIMEKQINDHLGNFVSPHHCG